MAKRKPETYLALCTEFYNLCKTIPPEDEYAFYRSYVKDARGPVLEPMCGTGRFLLPLLEEGFSLYGFDASKHMLESLKRGAQLKNLKPNVWQGFVEDLGKPGRLYDLIFIPHSSFCLITDLDQVLAILKSFYAHLNKEGILLFEAETLNAIPKQLGIWQGSIHPKTEQTMLMISFVDLFLGNNLRSRVCKYEWVDKGKVARMEFEEYKLRLYEPTMLLKLLSEAGFREIRIMKKFDRTVAVNNLDIAEESIIFECKK